MNKVNILYPVFFIYSKSLLVKYIAYDNLSFSLLTCNLSQIRVNG